MSTSRVRITLAAGLGGLVALAGCSGSNNLLMGRVEAQVGSHTVVVTDCYRTEVPAVESLAPTPEGSRSYRFAPCRDAVVELHGEELTVNGVSYGRIQFGDAVTVDHGTVLVNGHPPSAPSPR